MSDLVVERPKIRKRRNLPERDAHRPWQVSWEVLLADGGIVQYVSFYASWDHAQLIAQHTIPVETDEGLGLRSVSPLKDRIRCVPRIREAVAS